MFISKNRRRELAVHCKWHFAVNNTDTKGRFFFVPVEVD